MLIKSLLRRLVVGGNGKQQSVGPHALGLAAELNGCGGIVVAGAGDDGAAAADGVFDLAVQPRLFVHRQGRAFAGGAGYNQAVAAGIQQGVRQALGLAVVHAARGVKGRNHSGNQAANFRRHNKSLLLGQRQRAE